MRDIHKVMGWSWGDPKQRCSPGTSWIGGVIGRQLPPFHSGNESMRKFVALIRPWR